MNKTNNRPEWCNIINDTINDIQAHSRDDYDSFIEKCLEPYGITKENSYMCKNRVRIEEEPITDKGFDLYVYQRFYIDGEYCFTVVLKSNCVSNKDESGNPMSLMMSFYERIIEKDRLKLSVEEVIDILDKIAKDNDARTVQAIKQAEEAFENKKKMDKLIYGDICPIYQPSADFDAIEKALGFKLFYWQKTYIETGIYRRYGDTTAQVLRQLLDPKFNDIPIIIDKAKVYSKYSYYGYMMFYIKNKLDAAGIKTRPIEIKRGYWNE